MKNCFIIVNYNDYKSTKHLLDNIINFKCINNIIIVDNNSNDEERKLLSSINNKKVSILYNDENLGYSYGINTGAKYAIEKYGNCNLIISNSDIVIVDEADLKILINELDINDVGLVGPQILELGSINRGCKNVSPIFDLCRYTKIIKNLIPEKKYLYNAHLYDDRTLDVDIISSCFFLIKSETLKKINFMDELVFLYYEDYILSKKVKDLNLKVRIVNDVKVKHLYSITVDKVLKNFDKYKLFKESQIYYHVTYNNASAFERFILNLTKKIGISYKDSDKK